MKKIAFVIGNPTPDHAPLFREFTETSKELDLTVYFCSDFGVHKAEYEEDFKAEIKWDVPLLEGYKYKFLKNFSPIPSPRTFFGLMNFGIVSELMCHKYDAVLVNGYASFTHWLAIFGALMSRTPIIFRGEADLMNPRGFFTRISKRILLVPLFKLINAFMWSSTKNKEYYMHYGVSPEKLFFFPCAVDNAYWEKRIEEYKGSKDDLKNKFGIPKDRSVILFVGKLSALKHPMDILRAHETLLKEKINSSLVFVGDGSEMPKLKEYVAKQNLKNIFFAGFKNQSELSPYYAIADTLVFASEWDRSPKSMNEAMNFGVAIVACDRVGTAPDLIEEGKNGFVYPFGNQSALVESLKKTVVSSETNTAMKARSREIVSQWNFAGDIKGIEEAAQYVCTKK